MSKTIECNILLIGFMGAGKSTIARNLQRKLNFPLVEMDERIVREQGMSINDIFEIPLSLIGKYDDEEELKETIKSLTQDYLVLDNDVAYVDISNDTIEICTYSICSIELNDLVIRINENL